MTEILRNSFITRNIYIRSDQVIHAGRRARYKQFRDYARNIIRFKYLQHDEFMDLEEESIPATMPLITSGSIHMIVGRGWTRSF